MKYKKVFATVIAAMLGTQSVLYVLADSNTAQSSVAAGGYVDSSGYDASEFTGLALYPKLWLNGGASGVDAKVVTAIYEKNSNRMYSADIQDAHVEAGKSLDWVSPRFYTLPNPDDYYMSTMVFNSMSDIEPLVKNMTIASPQTEAKPVCLYVSQGASAGGNGTESSPFSNLNQARDKIRELKAQNNSQLSEYGAVVYIREGTYALSDSFSLTSQDSGSEEAPIVYRAYPGEDVKIVGGVALSAADFISLDKAIEKHIIDEAVKNRIIDETARKNVQCVNLKEKGITSFDEVYLKGAYSYWFSQFSHKAEEKQPSGREAELIVDGNALSVARYPNEGYLTIGKVKYEGQIVSNWFADKIGQPDYVTPEKQDPYDGFIIGYTDPHIDKWTNAKNIQLYGHWLYDWGDASVLVENIDATNNTIESKFATAFGVREGQRYYAYNLLEEIDIAGEYYLDRESGIMYLYPPAGYSSESEIYFSRCEDIVSMNKTSYVEFKNIEFTASKGNAVDITQGVGNKIIGCEFSNTADDAIKILGTDNGVLDCYLHDVNGGISLDGGDRITLTPGNNYAENNHIERFQRIDKTWNGAIDLNGVGHRASYNKIHDSAHNVIYPAGNNHLVEYNEIFDVLKESDDCGVINTNGDWTYRGTRLENNYLHDIDSSSTTGTGAYLVLGIYLDNRSSGLYVEGNVLENIRDGIFIHGGGDNVIKNNLLINIKDEPFKIANEALGGDTTDAETRLASVPWNSDVWKKAYPSLYEKATAGIETLIIPEGNVFDDNFVYNSDGAKTLPAASKAFTAKNNVATADKALFEAEKAKHPISEMGSYNARAVDAVRSAVVLCSGSNKALINGEVYSIPSDSKVRGVHKINNTMYVPLTYLKELYGVAAIYDEQTGIAQIQTDASLTITKDSTIASKSNASVVLEGAPYAIGKTLYVPIKSVLQHIGKQVLDTDGLLLVSNSLIPINMEKDQNLLRYLNDMIDIY